MQEKKCERNSVKQGEKNGEELSKRRGANWSITIAFVIVIVFVLFVIVIVIICIATASINLVVIDSLVITTDNGDRNVTLLSPLSSIRHRFHQCHLSANDLKGWKEKSH